MWRVVLEPKLFCLIELKRAVVTTSHNRGSHALMILGYHGIDMKVNYYYRSLKNESPLALSTTSNKYNVAVSSCLFASLIFGSSCAIYTNVRTLSAL